ncbi:MAG: hypothetical protein HY820_30145 [Acidobacteria bacterium]|nr:hypothetical protein [Acidobacteriota bacterium]
MQKLIVLILTASFAFSAPTGSIYSIDTIAGVDPSRDFGIALNTILEDAQGVAADPNGNLFIADTSRHRILRVSAAGVLSVVAGTGQAGFSGDNGPAETATLNQPYGLSLDSSGNLFIADFGNRRVRRLSPTGRIQTVAGGGSLSLSTSTQQALDVSLRGPRNLAIDPATGTLYISDFLDHRILSVSATGVISVFAGTGSSGPSVDTVAASAAKFSSPAGLLALLDGTVLVADSGNHAIRKINAGVVKRIATDAYFSFIYLPTAICLDSQGNLLVVSLGYDQLVRVTAAGDATVVTKGARDVVTDGNGNIYLTSSTQVRKISATGTMTTLAGVTGQFRGEGTPASQALLYAPADIEFDGSGNLLIADTWNHRVRRIRNGVIETVAGDGDPGFRGDGAPAIRAALAGPQGVAVDSKGVVYIADTDNHRVRRVALDGTISTIAGTGTGGFNGDAREVESAQLNAPASVAVNRSGAVFIADTVNHRVRMISNGFLVTIAGTGQKGYSGDAGGALGARFDTPRGLTFDAAGNLFVADSGNRRVRKVSASGLISTVVGPEAGLTQPNHVAVDSTGVLYVTDAGSSRVVRVNTDGTVETLAGTGSRGFSGDGGMAASALLSEPAGICLDAEGAIYVADRMNHRIRKLTVSAAQVPIIIVEPAAPLRALHGATLESTPVAPGMLITVEAKGIGPAIPLSAKVTAAGTVDTTLAGIQVRFDGKPAPILYAQENLINVQAPYRLAGSTQALLEVVRDGAVKVSATVPVAVTAPGIFTTSDGSATALNEDGTLNSASTPAARGSLLTFYATGEGAIDPAGQDGKLADLPYPVPLAAVQVDIGNKGADITAMGSNVSSPSILQLTVRIPQSLTAGPQPIVFTAGGKATQKGVTVFVK